MIRNFVFDLGRVLVEFDPEKGMEALNFSEAARQAFREHIFETGGIWYYTDRTDMDESEVRKLFKRHVPGFEHEVDMLWDNLHVLTSTYPYTAEWLRGLKQKGYHIYFLSNYGKAAFERNSEVYDFLDMADGRVISYEMREVKPDPPIYLELLRRYGLEARECLFIDDREENVAAARRLGFRGLAFTSFEQTKREAEMMCEGEASE